MTDGETQEIEPGSALPVPAELDGDSADEAEDQHGLAPNASGDNHDLFDADSNNGDKDGEGATDADRFGHLQIMEQMQSDLEQPPDARSSRDDAPLSEAEAKVLDSMVNQAMLSSRAESIRQSFCR